MHSFINRSQDLFQSGNSKLPHSWLVLHGGTWVGLRDSWDGEETLCGVSPRMSSSSLELGLLSQGDPIPNSRDVIVQGPYPE